MTYGICFSKYEVSRKHFLIILTTLCISKVSFFLVNSTLFICAIQFIWYNKNIGIVSRRIINQINYFCKKVLKKSQDSAYAITPMVTLIRHFFAKTLDEDGIQCTDELGNSDDIKSTASSVTNSWNLQMGIAYVTYKFSFVISIIDTKQTTLPVPESPGMRMKSSGYLWRRNSRHCPCGSWILSLHKKTPHLSRIP